MSSVHEDHVVVECRGLSKHYGGIAAVDSVNLPIRGGELLALVGDNGAGKSTLVKMLCGAVRPSSGEIRIDGAVVNFRNPMHARLMGIESVYQELALVPIMDVAENLYLGREIEYRVGKFSSGLLDRRTMARHAERYLTDLGISVPAIRRLPVSRLSGGQRQGIAIARAVAWASRLLIMDEPTAALGVKQSELVMATARNVVDSGRSLILITHTMPHVMRYADRIVVLRQGRMVADVERSAVSSSDLVALMVGASESLPAH